MPRDRLVFFLFSPTTTGRMPRCSSRTDRELVSRRLWFISRAGRSEISSPFDGFQPLRALNAPQSTYQSNDQNMGNLYAFQIPKNARAMWPEWRNMLVLKRVTDFGCLHLTPAGHHPPSLSQGMRRPGGVMYDASRGDASWFPP